MRACIISIRASLSLSPGTEPAASCSWMINRICRSRAAHPRVNEPAHAPSTIRPTPMAASIQVLKSFGNIVFIAASASITIERQSNVRLTGSWWPAVRLATGCATHGGSIAHITQKHRADGRIGIRADVPAGRVVHVMRWIGAVFLRCGDCAGGGADDKRERECGLDEHGHVSFDCVSHL